MRDPKILLVYPGLGKTYTAKIDSRVLEVQMGSFKNLLLKNYSNYTEILKGKEIDFVLNPKYPKNILAFLKRNLPGRIAVMALKPDNLKFCLTYEFPFAFIMPSNSKLLELKDQYIKRGNTPDYVEKMLNERLRQAQSIIKNTDAYVYTVNKGEHLINVLEKYIF